MRRLAFLLVGLLAVAAQAQDFPTRPIRMIVPDAPGGPPDTVTGIIGPKMAEALGQQIVVENRPGAGGISGTEVVARSTADGYTLLIADVGQLAINPHLFKALPYDPLKDLAPVSLIGSTALFLVLQASIPANDFRELVALAKAKPGSMNYGSSGLGSIHHLTTEAMKAAFGLDIVHVPFKGMGQAVPALLGGQVSMLFSALPAIEAHVKAGKVKLLAISVPQRSPQAPEVPTIAELGVPGFDFAPEIGLLAPAGTPPAIVSRLAAEVAKAVSNAAVSLRTISPTPSTALRAATVAASIPPASSLSSRCVRPSRSQRMRRKVQCPNGTPCPASLPCSARMKPRHASFVRWARRSDFVMRPPSARAPSAGSQDTPPSSPAPIRRCAAARGLRRWRRTARRSPRRAAPRAGAADRGAARHPRRSSRPRAGGAGRPCRTRRSAFRSADAAPGPRPL